MDGHGIDGAQLWGPLDALVDLCGDALAAFDDAGALQQANTAFYRLLGRGGEPAVLTYLRDLDQWLGSLCPRQQSYVCLPACRSNCPDVLQLQLPMPLTLQRTVHRFASPGRSGLICLVHLREQPLPAVTPVASTPLAGGSSGAVSRIRQLPRVLAERWAHFMGTPQPAVAPTLIDLLALVQHVLQQWPESARERPLYIEPAPPLRVPVAGEVIAQAMRELALNAAAYSPAGSPLRLSWHRRFFDGLEQIGLALGDQGRGMNPALDGGPSRPAGGLARVRVLMAAQSGELELFSRAGHGTRACLWLPLPAADHDGPRVDRDHKDR